MLTSTHPSSDLRVLHLCTDYARQSLYAELLKAVDEPGIYQAVHAPVRTRAEVGRFDINNYPRIQVNYSHILRPWHRVLFRNKIRRVHDRIRNLGLTQTASLIHAHFLYSDGAVAHRIHRSARVPYVVTVRNSDLYAFMRLRPDLKHLAMRVLQEAAVVLVPSPAYSETLLERLRPAFVEAVAPKVRVIPNGVPDFWMEEPRATNRTQEDLGHRVLYVGDFSKNKNVPRLIDAVLRLSEPRLATLTLVGGGGRDHHRVLRRVNGSPPGRVTFLGRIEDRQRLREVYRAHDIFAMPSFHETFGLVYVEALSQGLPIVHSRGQAVDGYFESGTVAEAVDPSNIDSIGKGIGRLMFRRASVTQECINRARRFSWSRVAPDLKETYLTALGVG